MQISETDLVKGAEQQLRSLLSPLPWPIANEAPDRKFTAAPQGVDFAITLGEGDQRWTIICDVKSNGQPRNIRAAALQLQQYARQFKSTDRIYAVVAAPFISMESGAICKELEVGYADLAGNCLLAFGNVYIEKSVAKNPFRVKREQRSLFAPKSARVLRVMLAEPSREWKVAELAARAGVSYGQVSNVRKNLINREWGIGNWGGVRLAKPLALLDAWKLAYKPMRRARTRYYTILHGEELQAAIRQTLLSLRMAYALNGVIGTHAVLNSFSAARWIAPFARITGEYFYADSLGEENLKNALKLEPATKGENIIIDVVSDEGVFQEAIEPAKGMQCTSLVQTYLDLASSGERGAEAAEFLRAQKIEPLLVGLK